MSDRYAGLRLEWSNWVEQWESSGLSAAEFCRRHDLPVLRFYSWRRRFRLWDQSSAGNDANVGGSFVPLAFREEHSPCGIAVVFSSGVRLELSTGFDADELLRTIHALEKVGTC
jgi:hypothetical protein